MFPDIALKSFNQYHQVDDTARINAVNLVFDIL